MIRYCGLFPWVALVRFRPNYGTPSLICCAAFGTAVFGLLFSTQSGAFSLILLGILITTSNNLLSYAYHAYQDELFPTRVRAKAVGFVYSSVASPRPSTAT